MRPLIIIASFLLFGCAESKNDCSCDYPTDTYSPIDGLYVYDNLQSGIECAENCNKPILLWFTGFACISSRKMEGQIFVEDRNFQTLKDDYVVVTLYVDDPTELPEEEIEIWNNGGKEIEVNTIGRRNSKFQIEQFGIISQPHFVVLSSNGNDVIDQFGYLPNAAKADSILTRGIKKVTTASIKLR